MDLKRSLRTSVFASALHQVQAADQPSKKKTHQENIPTLEQLFTRRHVLRTSPGTTVSSRPDPPTTETRTLPLVVSVTNALEWINQSLPLESHTAAKRATMLCNALLPDDEADPVAAFGPPLPKGKRFTIPALSDQESEQRCWQLVAAGRAYNTNAGYKPPTPFVADDPFVPFAIAAVQLEKEQMVVLGQVVKGVGVDDLKVGMPVELVLETLHETDEDIKLTWKWQPSE